MGSVYVTANAISTSGNTESVSESYDLYESPGVAIVDEAAGSSGADAIFVAGFGYVNIMGAVYGPTALFFSSVTYYPGDTTSVQIGATGSLDSSYYGDLVVANGAYQITNAGDIQNSVSYGVELDFETLVSGATVGNTPGAGGGALVNTGFISAAFGSAVGNEDTATADTDVVTNYGVISSSGGDGLSDTGGHETIVNNFGSISGGQFDDAIYASGQEQLTNTGTINGQVYLAGANSKILNSGVIDGGVAIGAGSVNNSGTIDGGINAANGFTLTDSGAITGLITSTGATLNLENAQISVLGSGDTVDFVTGPSDVATLSGATAWDSVVGSDGTVNLSGALTSVTGGGDTINFAQSTTDYASLWNTTNNWDSVYGANGNVYLNDAISSIVGGGDTVNFSYGFDNIASLWNTGGVFDTVNGSNNTVYLSNAQANIIGGGDAVEFFYGAGDTASLFNTGGVADTITNNTGVGGTLFINNAQANVTGSGEVIDFTSAGADSVNVSGNSESFIAQPVNGAETITGYNATDQVYLSAAQFGSSWSAFLADVSGTSSAVITDPNNHANTLTLVGVAPSSLAQANFHFG